MRSLRRKLPSANALFAFEAAARCGNFSKAALELYVTQPAVSRMLSRMEDHLGVKLFVRASGGVQLTECGEILYRRVSDGFRGIESALEEIEARTTGMETVTLSVTTAFTTHWLMPRLGALRDVFPLTDLRFQLVSGAISGPVDDVDIGMRYVTEKAPDETGVFVMPEILLPVCSPGYAEQRRTTQGSRDVFLHLGDGERDSRRRFKAFGDAGPAAKNDLTFTDYAVVLQAALLGQGVALGWLNSTSHWLRNGALVPVVPEVSVTPRSLWLLQPANKPARPATNRLRDWIVQEMRSDVEAIDLLYPALQLMKHLPG